MGWSTQFSTKEKLIGELISHLKNNVNHTYIRHSLVGNHLWFVVENRNDGKRIIGLYLIRSFGNGEYGYKAIDELAHPYYYDCPLSFFKLANDLICEEWRTEVKQYHRKKKDKQVLLRSIKPGDVIQLSGCKIPRVTVTSIIDRKIYGEYNNVRYRIPNTLIAV